MQLVSLMYYFNFQNILTGHLNDKQELKYYQNEIKHILLLFDRLNALICTCNIYSVNKSKLPFNFFIFKFFQSIIIRTPLSPLFKSFNSDCL